LARIQAISRIHGVYNFTPGRNEEHLKIFFTRESGMTIAISGNKHRTCYRTGVAIEYNITYFIPEGG